jgi:phenylacetate-CoA ligase
VRQEPPLPIAVEGDAGLADAIATELRAALTFSAQVRMVAPKSLPRSDYKSKLVDFSGAT